MRVFAGPNGSGKSTVISKIRIQEVNGYPIDFGHYINADDIARHLTERPLLFSEFEIKTVNNEFKEIALASGLVGAKFSQKKFEGSYSLRANKFYLKENEFVEQLAQIVADFLRKKLLGECKKFSFETVFSHDSKIDIMRQASAAGYKVYLYFVSTISPEINKFRVEARVRKGGHAVPPDKIVSRYMRSMDLLYEACQEAYQVFFFDNSKDGSDSSVLFAHFKKSGDRKEWDPVDPKEIPSWFHKYYSDKIPK